jgi:hypothetical protein
VAESRLEKVLRLANGVTRSYVHNVNGRPVQVSQYRTPHPAGPKKPASTASSAFGSLKVGQIVQIRNQNYKVTRVNIPPSTGSGVSTGSQGTGLNTASTAAGAAAAATAQSNASAATAAAAAAKLFGTPQQNPAQAALNGQTIPNNAAVATNLLTSLVTGRYWYTRLPTSFMVKVVG